MMTESSADVPQTCSEQVRFIYIRVLRTFLQTVFVRAMCQDCNTRKKHTSHTVFGWSFVRYMSTLTAALHPITHLRSEHKNTYRNMNARIRNKYTRGCELDRTHANMRAKMEHANTNAPNSNALASRNAYERRLEQIPGREKRAQCFDPRN